MMVHVDRQAIISDSDLGLRMYSKAFKDPANSKRAVLTMELKQSPRFQA